MIAPKDTALFLFFFLSCNLNSKLQSQRSRTRATPHFWMSNICVCVCVCVMQSQSPQGNLVPLCFLLQWADKSIAFRFRRHSLPASRLDLHCTCEDFNCTISTMRMRLRLVVISSVSDCSSTSVCCVCVFETSCCLRSNCID